MLLHSLLPKWHLVLMWGESLLNQLTSLILITLLPVVYIACLLCQIIAFMPSYHYITDNLSPKEVCVVCEESCFNIKSDGILLALKIDTIPSCVMQ